MDAIWEREIITDICNKQCVCIKLENDSTAGRQFSQIYPVLVVPCTYLIGNDGLPIEIIGGAVTEEELLKKIENALQVRKNPLPSMRKAETTSTDYTSSSSSPATSVTQLANEPTSSSTPDLPTDSMPSRPDTDAMLVSTDDDIESPTSSQNELLAKRTEEVQQRIRQRRKERTEQAEEDDRRREIERRKTGKSTQCMKEKQEEAKRIRELEERRNEKLAEQEALDRVRDEIARDRAEKKRKFEEETRVRKAEEEKKREELRKKREEEEKVRDFERRMMSRIQYRFPDGSTVNRLYPRDTTLRTCMDDLITNEPKRLPKAFQFFTTMPRCVFDTDDEDTTLASLGLVPSASVYIRPKTTPVLSGGQRGCVGYIIAFFIFLFSIPFKAIFWIWNKLTGASPIPPRTSMGSDNEPQADNKSKGSAPRPAAGSRRYDLRSRDNRTKETKRDGNMRRLHDVKRDDDDEGATWNGNSTQQM